MNMGSSDLWWRKTWIGSWLKNSLITLGSSPAGMHGGTAYPLTEKQEKIWALIESLNQKIMKKSH